VSNALTSNGWDAHSILSISGEDLVKYENQRLATELISAANCRF
jgi:hypothetical protein